MTNIRLKAKNESYLTIQALTTSKEACSNKSAISRNKKIRSELLSSSLISMRQTSGARSFTMSSKIKQKTG